MDPDNHQNSADTNADGYQQAWQSQTSQVRITVDSDLLLREVQRNHRCYRTNVIFLDVMDIVVEAMTLALWIYLGFRFSSPWTWYLAVPVIVWSIGYAIARLFWRRRTQQSAPGLPLIDSVKESLRLVDQQIWMARNSFRLSILPLAIALSAYFVHSIWQRSDDWLDVICNLDIVVFALCLFYFLYRVTRLAGNKKDVRREELLQLLAELGDEAAEEQRSAYEAQQGRPNSEVKSLVVVGLICFITPVLFAILGDYIEDNRTRPAERSRVARSEGVNYPKLSPFAAIRWNDTQPEIRIEDQWFRLVALNDLPSTEIVGFSQQEFSDRWKKRFEEDLVEVLSRMGHPPQVTVQLVIESLDTSETIILDDIPLTAENRQAIVDAAQARASREP